MDKEIVFYDANFAVDEHRGMGYFIKKLTNVLDEHQQYEVLGLLARGKTDKNAITFGFRNYILWEQLSLCKYVNNHPDKFFFFPYNTAPIFLKPSSKHVLIVHDLIFYKGFQTKSIKQKIGLYYRRFVLPRVIRKIDKIITVSEYSKNELITTFKINPKKIAVVPNSVEFNYSQIEQNIPFADRADYIFHIGGEPRYKNTIALLYAFQRLKKELRDRLKIKIVGIRNTHSLLEFKETAISLGIAEQIEFLPYQTDQQIEALYNNAKLFVFPSIHEGFGIPIIEAFKYGCPVICSNSSCLPEIAGDAARYFCPDDYSTLANQIEETLLFPEITNELIAKGYRQLERYSSDIFNKKVLHWWTEVKKEWLIRI